MFAYFARYGTRSRLIRPNPFVRRLDAVVNRITKHVDKGAEEIAILFGCQFGVITVDSGWAPIPFEVGMLTLMLHGCEVIGYS